MSSTIRKTFRLSPEAIAKIEKRNREVFPTENDYVEQKILSEESDRSAVLSRILSMLQEEKNSMDSNTDDARRKQDAAAEEYIDLPFKG